MRSSFLLPLSLCVSCVVAPEHDPSLERANAKVVGRPGVWLDEQGETSSAAEIEAFEQQQDRARLASAAIIASSYASLYAWTYFAWYRGRQTNSFQILDEGLFARDTYAGGADKLGHFYANYVFLRATSQILERGGWSRRSSRWTAATLTASFFTVIEAKDGVHKGFGFSLSDMTANMLGLGLGMALETYPPLDRALSLRFEYVPTREFIDQLVTDGVVNAAEDYSGQTTYMAYHLDHALPNELPRWIDWLRYVDLIAGLGSRNYLPALEDSMEPYRQELHIGVSLNVQKLLDPWLDGEQRQWRGARSTARFLSEVVQVPYTKLHLTLDREYQGQLMQC